MPDQVIRAIGNQFLASALLMLKHALDKQGLQIRLSEFLSIGLPDGNEQQQTALLIYGFELVDLPAEQIQEVLQKLPSDMKVKAKSTYEQLIEKGMEKGIKQGWKQGVEHGIEKGAKQARANAHAEKLRSALKMKKSGFEESMIADLLDLPDEEVRAL